MIYMPIVMNLFLSFHIKQRRLVLGLQSNRLTDILELYLQEADLLQKMD